MTIQYEKILEFHDLFPEEDLNIYETLRKYNRQDLVACATILGYNFVNARMPDNNNVFFSKCSVRHMEDLNVRFKTFLASGKQKDYCYLPMKTSLELMRCVFSIPVKEYKNNATKDYLEYDVFRVILKINENLMSFVSNKKDDLAVLTFLHFYITNDFSISDDATLFTRQALYYSVLSEFIENDERCKEARASFYEKAGVKCMEQYAKTWLTLYALVSRIKSNPKQGCPVLDLKKTQDPDNLITRSVLDFFSIEINDYIAYDSFDTSNRDNNVDYRVFRAHPLIKINDCEYIIYNSTILINRLYNSLFFDLKDHFGGDAFNFYNKEFVEKRLFLRSALKCVEDRNCSAMFPSRPNIESDQVSEENPNQPDFYIREGKGVILFECKAIRINGEIKDRADIDDLIKTLQNKLYESVENTDETRRNKKNPERVGVTQLVYQAEKIKTYDFSWDSKIPSDFRFYPVLVIEDQNIVVPGISGIINDWYKPLIAEKDLPENKCLPVIVMSINTLMKYSKVFKKYGFHKIFDEYYEIAARSVNGGMWEFNPLADFDVFMAERHPLSSKDSYDLFEEAKRALGLPT